MPKRSAADVKEERDEDPNDDRTVANDSGEDQEYKPGSIRRVRLKNFLTYNNVEFRPGPRLNVVIGPNGTGKSTILCAICLGLGGQPPLLGRADDARTFITHNQEVAEIEIELAARKNGPVHIVRRVIERSKGAETGKGIGSSSYFINNKSVNIKAIQTLVKDTYNIAIENLCTFLPQDRVGSFSAIDPKGLLHETEKSLSGSQQLYHDHMALIRLEEEYHSSGTDLTTIQDKLAKLEEDQARLEHEKKKLEERERYLEQMKLLNQKKIWLQFDEAKEKIVEFKEKRQALKDKTKEAEASLEPLKEQLATMSQDVEQVRAKSREIEKNIGGSWKNVDTGNKKAEKIMDEIENSMENLQSLDASKAQKEKRVREFRAKLATHERAQAEYPPLADMENSQRTAKEQLNQARRLYNDLKRVAESKMGQLKEQKELRDSLMKKVELMNDEKARRNEKIFRNDSKLYETFQFVEQMKRELRHPVWGPIVCEISTKNANGASYLEQHVAIHTMKSFVVESREDYNLLYREAREKRNLSINIMVIEGGILKPFERMYSESRMAMLKRDHGIIGYLDEAFDAPPAVMQALIESSHVDGVLVGSPKTQESLDKHGLLDILSEREDGKGLRSSCLFFSSRNNRSFKYQSTVSRYSGKPALRVDEVLPAKMLSPGVSPEEKQLIQDQLSAAIRNVEALEPEVHQATAAVDKASADGQDANSRLKDASKAINELQESKARVEQSKKKLKEAEQELAKGDDGEKTRLVTALKAHITKYISSLEHSSLHCDEWMKSTVSLAGVKLSEEAILEKKDKINFLYKEKKEEFDKLVKEFQQADNEYEKYRKNARELMEKAKEVAPLRDAQGNDLPLKASLDKLPSDLNEIEEALEDALNRVKAVHDNPEVLRRYEEQRVEIARIRLQLENMNSSKDLKKNEIRRLREPWEGSLNSAMNEVNELFSNYMKELGCAGEVRISRGNMVDDDNRGSRQRAGDDCLGNFKEWGIQIRVKFREKSDLQTLSAHVHSGGERSVSTIMYLMALQDKMVSPFRCVDEINQGLDERNERLVFRRIVQNSTQPPIRSNDPSSHTGQYFLITPKLLPNLTDMENDNVTVLCIFNGPRNFKHFSDWNVESFLKNRTKIKQKSRNEDIENVKEEDIRPPKKRIVSD